MMHKTGESVLPCYPIRLRRSWDSDQAA